MPGRFMIQRRELVRGHGERPARLDITTVESGLSKSEGNGKLRKYKAQDTPYTIYKLVPEKREGDRHDDPRQE